MGAINELALVPDRRPIGENPAKQQRGPHDDGLRRTTMGKTGRKRRARKKKAANHGKRPNA